MAVDYDWDTRASQMHGVAVVKGFWGEPEMMDKYMAKLALVHSELTEILEALRKGKGSEAVAEEFADAFIRLEDLWGALVEDGIISDVSLQEAYNLKWRKNINRPTLHGHKWG